MTETQVVQIVTRLFVAAFGLLLFRIAAGHWYCKFGREALLCASAYVLTTFAIGMTATMEWITGEEARVINGFVAFGFVSILSQIVYLHRVFHNQQEGHQQGG